MNFTPNELEDLEFPLDQYEQTENVYYKPLAQRKAVGRLTEETEFIVVKSLVENPNVNTRQVASKICKMNAISLRLVLINKLIVDPHFTPVIF